MPTLSSVPAWLWFAFLVLPLAARADDPAPIVNIAGKKAAVVKKVDKTIYDVSSAPKAANGTAQDVLQSTPELAVTADGKIAVKGNSQVTVLVNGKPTAMMSGDERAVALQTMSGADISSIEVITNPSAAYNANGGAIVNIVLKRHRKPGAQAQVKGSVTDQGLWNAGTSADATSKNISVHGSLGLRRDGTRKWRRSSVEWINPASGERGATRQESEVFVRRTVQSAALGLDYDPSEADSFSLSGAYNARRSRPLFDVLNETRSDAGGSVYHRISYGPNEQSDGSASLSYSHQGKASALKAMLQRSATVGLIDKSYRDVFTEPALPTGYSHGATRASRHLNQATIDWTAASGHGQWSLGLDIQHEVNDLDNYQAAVDPMTGAEVPDPTTSNGYAVTSRLSALYLTDQIRSGKWELLLGARAERMALEVSPAVGLAHKGHWRAINPSLNMRYAYSDQADLTFSYRRSLQRPDPRDLNPFTTYVDAQNLSRGNPGLRPQLLDSWEIGVNTEAAPFSKSLAAFYRSSRDTVTDARSFADAVLVTGKQNGGRAASAGVTGSLDWTLDATLKLGLDGGAYRVMLDTPDLSDLVHQSGNAGYVNLRAAYSAGGNDLTLDAHGQSSSITPLGRYGATSSVNLGWKHKLSNTLSLTVNANDIFDGSKRSYRTDTSSFRQSGFDHFIARRVYVGLVKKIG